MLVNPRVRAVIDMSEPVAVILAAVLHFLSADSAAAVCASYMSRAARGSWLIVSSGHYQDTELATRLQQTATRIYPVLEPRRRRSGVDAGRAGARRPGSVRGAQMDNGDRRRADRKTGVRAGRRRRQVPVSATPDYGAYLAVIVATFAHFGRKPDASVLMCHRLLGGDEMNRGAPTSAASSRRVRIAASSALVLAVLIGGSLYLARGAFSSGPSSAGRVTSSRTTAPGCGTAGTAPAPTARPRWPSPPRRWW